MLVRTLPFRPLITSKLLKFKKGKETLSSYQSKVLEVSGSVAPSETPDSVIID